MKKCPHHQCQCVICLIILMSLKIYRMLLFSVNFLVSSIGCANKCSLELPLLLLPEGAHHRRAELLDLLHGLMGILTAQELHVPEGVGETNLEKSKKPLVFNNTFKT